MDRSALIEEVRGYRDDSLRFTEMLHEIRSRCGGEPGSLFIYLTTGLGIAKCHASQSWTEEALQLLESADEEFTWSA